jgi:hypothetical protein
VKLDWTPVGPGIEAYSAASAADFLALLSPTHSAWFEGPASPWIFRGHASDSWELLPAAWRSRDEIIQKCRADAERRFATVAPQQVLNWFWPPDLWSGQVSFGKGDKQAAERLTIETTAELLPLWDFMQRCDELGLASPLMSPPPDPVFDRNWLNNPNNPLVADEILNYPNCAAALVLAQTAGLPTRLLTWIKNPKAAAFFALNGFNELRSGDQFAVWALHRTRAENLSATPIQFPHSPSNAGKIGTGLGVLEAPTPGNISNNEGGEAFTITSRSGIYFMQNGGRRLPLDRQIIASSPREIVLRKISLPHRCVDALTNYFEHEPAQWENGSMRAYIAEMVKGYWLR